MAKKRSQGTKLYISQETTATAYGSATFVQVKGVTEIGEPDGEAAEIPITDLDSEATEFMMGLPDNGKYPISGHAVTADPGQAEMLEARNNQELRWFKQVDSTGAVAYHEGVVPRFSTLGASVNGVKPMSGTIRISGPIY